MANKIASKRRVNAIIKQFEAAEFLFLTWTEDGEYDSPKLTILTPDRKEIIVAVEDDYIGVSPWENYSVNYVDYSDVGEYFRANLKTL